VASDPWWKQAVIYQIYPRSFATSTAETGEGATGDLAGITARLDYLAWLGIDVIWISPFFRSPMHDFGYDVSDYCDVDPIFGTLADFDRLVAAAHERGLRVMIDWVPAHTSSEHPWFVEARSGRSSAKRDWYVWRDPGPDGGLPNNWRSAFLNKPAWSFDEASGQYYLHSFLAEQPDLDWNNREVVEAMLDTLRFWLDRGVDGFRADVVHNIGKDPALRDVEGEIARIPHCALNDDPRTHGHLREIRAVIDSYPGDCAIVGEVFLLSTAQLAAYYGSHGRKDELHMSFNFPPLFAPWQADAWRGHIEETGRVLGPVDAWPTWVLSNHDQKRQRTRYGTESRARAAAVLLLTLRGTPFLYMGEELGLEDAVIPEERQVDPGGRDGCRAPIPWSADGQYGWGASPWLPWPPDADARNVEAMRDDEGSILQLYRRLLQARRASEALRRGGLQLLSTPEDVLGYRREHAGDRRLALINFASESRQVDLDEAWVVEVDSTARKSGGRFGGRMDADQALVLAPPPPGR
jgi:alpha-glucosidase